jgi:glycosyltransferase involved in cell wall biosynthesis
MTGLCVSYNTKDLLKRAIESILKFHPSLPILIIDGSDKDNPCYQYVQSIKSNQIQVIQLGVNIGHGKGMDLGIRRIQTQYALIFDTDIVMLKSPLSEMLRLMERDSFGCGWVTEIGTDGYDYGTFPHQKKDGPVKYLHPYFQLVDVKNYKKYYPYVQHGAPCYKTMIDIKRRGLSNKILKHFTGLTGHTNGKGANWVGTPSEYIQHDFGGTRMANKAAGKKEIIGVWDRTPLPKI